MEMSLSAQKKMNVLAGLASVCLYKTNDMGILEGGIKKMVLAIDLHEYMVVDYPDITLAQIVSILDELIRLTGESPIKFLRRELRGTQWMWYGISKKGWLFLQKEGYDVPDEAILWAYEPPVAPTRDQLETQQANSGNKLSVAEEKIRRYNESLLPNQSAMTPDPIKDEAPLPTPPPLKEEPPVDISEPLPTAPPLNPPVQRSLNRRTPPLDKAN